MELPIRTTAEKINLSEIKRALSILVKPDDVVELRALYTKQATVSGYFIDHEKMAKAGAALSGGASGIYFTINPVNNALLARAENRTEPYAKHTTSDKDITRRRWFPVDSDPNRPSGISSTNAEHEAAMERANEIFTKSW
jgi:hypothetical protein